MSGSAAGPSKQRTFLARSGSTLLLWAVVLGVFFSGQPWLFVGLILLLGAGASGEVVHLFSRQMGRLSRWLAVALGLLVAVGVSWGQWGGGGEPVERGFELEMAGLVLVFFLAFGLQFRHSPQGLGPVQAVTSALFCYLYLPVFFCSFALRLTAYPDLPGPLPGSWLLLMMIATVKFTDMGAYLSGSLFGKHPMAPHISPAKTWEGFAGALLFAQLGLWGTCALAGESLAWLPSVHRVTLGVLLGLLAVGGDLAESVLKRCLSAKDSGKVLPGIGGLLDLLDSLACAAPALYFYLKVFGF